MKAFLALLLASGIYCRGLKGPHGQHHLQQRLLQVTDELRENALDLEDAYYGNSIFEENFERELSAELIQRLNQYYLLIEDRLNRKPDLKLSRLDKAVYLFVKAMKQRNKRQNKAKYLTMCHFKICNIGGKRNVRYAQMPKSNVLGERGA